jgi:hypothetical protein
MTFLPAAWSRGPDRFPTSGWANSRKACQAKIEAQAHYSRFRFIYARCYFMTRTLWQLQFCVVTSSWRFWYADYQRKQLQLYSCNPGSTGICFLILLRLEDHHRMLTTDLTNHSCTVAAAAPIGTDRRCCHNCSCKLELLLCFHMPSTLYYFLRKKNIRDCCGKVWPVVPSVRCGRHEL